MENEFVYSNSPADSPSPSPLESKLDELESDVSFRLYRQIVGSNPAGRKTFFFSLSFMFSALCDYS